MSEAQTLLNSRKFDVRRLVTRGSDGAARNFDFVVHPGAAVILPLLDDGRVLLIRNFRPALGIDLLELPAGTLEPPEPALACARRELREETGYSAARIEPLLDFYSSPGFCNERLFAFVATGLTAAESAREPGEQIELAPLSYADALAAIRDGQVVDGKTISTLLYYDRYQHQQEPR